MGFFDKFQSKEGKKKKLMKEIMGDMDMNDLYDKKHGMKEGAYSGVAHILEMNETGQSINNQPEYEFLLQIMVPGKEPYEAEHKQELNQLQLTILSAARQLPVVIDQKDNIRLL